MHFDWSVNCNFTHSKPSIVSIGSSDHPDSLGIEIEILKLKERLITSVARICQCYPLVIFIEILNLGIVEGITWICLSSHCKGQGMNWHSLVEFQTNVIASLDTIW